MTGVAGCRSSCGGTCWLLQLVCRFHRALTSRLQSSNIAHRPHLPVYVIHLSRDIISPLVLDQCASPHTQSSPLQWCCRHLQLCPCSVGGGCRRGGGGTTVSFGQGFAVPSVLSVRSACILFSLIWAYIIDVVGGKTGNRLRWSIPL